MVKVKKGDLESENVFSNAAVVPNTDTSCETMVAVSTSKFPLVKHLGDEETDDKMLAKLMYAHTRHKLL